MVMEDPEVVRRRRRNREVVLVPEIQAKRKVLNHRHALQANIDALLLAVQEGKCDRAAFEGLILDAQGSSEGIDDFLSRIVETKYYNEHRADDSTIATRVFNTPELLEGILRHCDYTDIMTFEQTCKSAKAII
ncbi:hypothetical protein LTR37_019794 [Vermiconidia calcicola]|uniref:Uncharacterized protein n=1 Tax=Vermiconidia calcicola TaxID=1690605 RepID=A0ACC3MD58_9PEZI|nr:hypothetical protein LTR37_019794 [Vermiconidia calcicola]